MMTMSAYRLVGPATQLALVGKYYVRCFHGRVIDTGRVIQRHDFRWRVETQGNGPLFVKASEFRDWRFFDTPAEREAWLDGFASASD